MSSRRKDISLAGQEYELDMSDGTTVAVRVVKSQWNDGYGLLLRDVNTDRPINFDELCEETYGEIPPLYTEDDITQTLSRLFDDNVDIGHTIPEWEEARSLETLVEYKQLTAAQEEILSGVYVESHAVLSDVIFLRFGQIVMRCEARWID
jgi:hypothetical protein